MRVYACLRAFVCDEERSRDREGEREVGGGAERASERAREREREREARPHDANLAPDGYDAAWAPGGANSRAILMEQVRVPALPTRQGLPLR